MTGSQARLIVFDTPEKVASAGAAEFVTRSHAAVAARGKFAVALSGGHTPAAMFDLLAGPDFADLVAWENAHVFWGDERCVPPDDSASNYCMAHERLLSKVPVPQANVHRIRGELDPHAAAVLYREELQTFFGGPTAFDLTYLGLGPEGHTASLFPGSPALDETELTCVATHVADAAVSPWRVTLTFPALNASRAVVFLVEGVEKAGIVAQVLEGERDVHRFPAQGIAPRGTLLWLLDGAAASRLSHSPAP